MEAKRGKLGNVLFLVFILLIIALVFTTLRTRLRGEDPSLMGHRLFMVESGSMSPTLKIGSLILVKEIGADQVRPEDIISYYGSERSIVTHRVKEIEEDGRFFITKGDANETEDPMPLDGKKLIGRVTFSIPYIGFLIKMIQTKLGIVVLGIIIGASLIINIFPWKRKLGNKIM